MCSTCRSVELTAIVNGTAFFRVILGPIRLLVIIIIMRAPMGAALSVAPRPSVYPSVRPSRASDFLETGQP